MTLMRYKNKKGFTLIEMLVVIAVIAVLVAIVIPTVTSSTEKAREATDLSNVRSAYAELMTSALSGEDTFRNAEGNYVTTVDLVQKEEGWTTNKDDYRTSLVVAGCTYDNGGMKNLPSTMCTISYYAESQTVEFDWGGTAVSGNQNPYAAFAQNLNNKIATGKQTAYLGSYCTLDNDPDSVNYNKFVSSLEEQLGVSADDMYFDFNPAARGLNGEGTVNRLRYTNSKINLSENGNWTYVPNDTVFTVVDMDKNGNILRIYTNTVSSSNKAQVGPTRSGATTKGVWDNTQNYVLVYDASDPDAVLPGDTQSN